MRRLLAMALLLPALGLAQDEAEQPQPEPPRPAQPPQRPAQPSQRPPLRAGMPVGTPGATRQAPPPPGAAARQPGQAAPAAAPGRAATTAPPTRRGATPGQPSAAPPGRAATTPPAARPGAAPGRAGAQPAGRAATVPAGAAGGTARAEGSCVPMQGRFLLAFNKAEIVDVLEQASRWTCRNFIFTDEAARGKITLLSKSPVTADEAYAAFLAALSSNGIGLYQSGKYWKLVRIADAKKTPIPTLLDDGGEVPQQEQPVTKLLRLKHIEPDQLRAVLGNFLSPQGADLQVIQPDLLIITDIGLNVRRVERIIETIDRPGSTDLIRVIQVQYASARDIADKINQVFATGPGQPGRPAARRPVIGGLQAGTAPGAAPISEAAEVSLTKVLADERTNKLVVIADEKSFQRILELVKQLDTPTAGEGAIHVVFLKNANAEDLAQTLQALAQGQAAARRSGATPGPVVPPPPGQPAQARAPSQVTAELFSGEVKITADKPSNSLVVLASGSDYAVLVRLIEKLDRPRRQVFVEAVLMEVNVSNDSQIGVAAHAAIPINTAQGKGFIPIGLEPQRINSLNPLGALQAGGFLTGMVGPVSADIKDIFPFPSMAILIQALQTSSDVNVLSTPHLLAQDNEESEIVVGQNVPFQAGYNPGFNTSGLTGATTGTTTATNLALASFVAPIQRQNVDLKLKIKPQIHEGDMVRLELEEQAEEIVARDPQLGPTTAKRSVKTKIVAKDQSTVVIGGLIQNRNVTSVQKVPLLGDIPIIGWLFRDTVTTKTKSNLLLFLTPYIIKDQADYRRILERKQKEQREFMEQFYGRQPGYEVAADWGRKPGPFSKMRQEVRIETQRLENGGPGAPGERVIGPREPPSERPVRQPTPEPTPAPPPAAAPAPPPEPAPPVAPPPATPPPEGAPPEAAPPQTPSETQQ
ncbi:MAG TPA: type II secretion system secretin GspD [Anaeromyxobacteraceae bacterium]|nr:type II secretion system secretin GspD [Anaeromyxobacteraceae bacterium]